MAGKKEFKDYRYLSEEDYDKALRINGESVPLYSESKLTSLCPDKDRAILGETWEKKKRDRREDIGRVDIAGKWLYVSKNGRHSRFFRKPAAYAGVEGGGFIALLKLRLLPFILLLALILVGVGIAVFPWGGTAKPVDPDAEDPNLVIASDLYYSITGTVTRNGEIVAEAALSLQSGNTELASTVIDENGTYIFTNVADGTYNIVCTVGNSVLTRLADVEGESIIVDFEFPDSDVKAIVRLLGDDTPAIAVGGLDEEARLQAIPNREVDITLLAKQLSEENVPAKEKAAIEAISGDLTLTWLDLKVRKEVFKNGLKESFQYLHQTKTVLEIAVPFDSSESAGTYVFRYHGGEAQRLTQLSQKPTGNYKDCTYYTDIDTVYIYTNSFSLYAIGYADAGAPAQGSDMLIFSDGATVNVKSKTVSMYYSHDRSATHNARVEIYLVGKSENLLVARSGIIPPGNELSKMTLSAKSSALPSDASYEGLMRITYLGTDGKTADTNVELPITVTITRS